jgi:hypothetical protein
MNPLELFLLVAGAAAYSLHKKRWGWLFFLCAFMAWIVLMQVLLAVQSHGSLF